MAIDKINPGRLRHLFTIKKIGTDSTTLTDLGRDDTTTISDHATIKGEIKRLSGDEQQLLQQTFGSVTHEFACWYVSGITNKMWLQGLNGKRFNIVDVDNVEEKNKWLYILLASETS